MALYGALSKHLNLSDLADPAAARFNLRLAEEFAGDVFYVFNGTFAGANAGADVLNAGTRTTPFKTLDFAIGQTTANKGDVIYLLPGHAENITTDAGVALDVAGITVVGLGEGTLRPTFTVATADAANMSVTAANITLLNLVFKSNRATVVNLLEIAGDHCEVAYCEFDESTLSALVCILVGLADGDADDTWIHHCKFYWDQPSETNTGDAAISIAFDSDRIVIEDNFIYGDFDLAAIDVLATGNACDFLRISDNYVENTFTGQHAIQIENAGTMTGLLVYDNKLVADVPNTTVSLHTARTWGNEMLSAVGAPRHIYCDSNGGGSNSGEGTMDNPTLTLNGAMDLVTADHGDIIHVAAGHNEALTAADAVDCDVSGVQIIGEGSGSNKPSFDYDDANGEFVIGAAGVLIENLRFVVSANATAKAIDVEVAGTDFVIRKCEFGYAETAADEFVDAIIINGATHNGVIEDCFFDAGAQAAATAISLSGAVIGITIRKNTMIGDYSVACIEGLSTLSENVIIEDNLLWNGVTSGLNAAPCISLLTGTIGVIKNNTLACNMERVAASVVADGCFLFNNTYTESADVFTGIKSTSELGGWRVAHTAVTTGMGSGFDTGTKTIFTVTGDVIVMAAWFVVGGTAVTSASDLGVWSLGTTGSTALLQATITLASGVMAANDVWSNGTSVPEGVVIENVGAEPFLISGDSTNIILTIITQNTTAGTGDFYCMWMPASPDGAVTGSTI